MYQLEIIATPFPLDGMLVHHRVPSRKQLGLSLLSPGWDARPSQGTQNEETRSSTAASGWDAGPSQSTQLEATRSITIPFPGLDASPSQGTQYKATRSITSPLDGMLVHCRVPPAL